MKLFDTEETNVPFSMSEFRESNQEAPELEEWIANMAKLDVGAWITVDHGAGQSTVRRVK